MAVSSAVVAITSSAALIASPLTDADNEGGSDCLINNTGTSIVYLGGSGVTTVNGFPLAVGASISLNLVGSDAVYAIAASTGSVTMLRTGV